MSIKILIPRPVISGVKTKTETHWYQFIERTGVKGVDPLLLSRCVEDVREGRD